VKKKRAQFHPADAGTTYLAFGSHVSSGVALQAGQAPAARVQLSLTGKWNHGAADELQVLLTPELAKELGGYLGDAAEAAEHDLARYLEDQDLLAPGWAPRSRLEDS
jgi:hypothetical protein